MVIDGTKKCGKCSMVKTIDNFYRNRNLGDGYAYYCKTCSKSLDVPRGKKYYQENKEVVHARHLEWNRNHPEKIKAYVKKSQKKYPEKQLARDMVNNAIKSGKISRQPCSVCGNIKSHAHHEDYYKPLEVIWICTQHHREVHKCMAGQPNN